MNESKTVSLLLLQYEALSPEKPGTQLLGESYINFNAPRGAENGVFLAQNATTHRPQVYWQNPSGKGCGKGDFLPLRSRFYRIR
jgi:hypothetical protein